MADNKFKFPWERTEDQEAIRKRANEFQKKQQMLGAPEEAGIEEQDLENIVPGGSYIAAVTPVGMGKKILKKGAKLAAEEAVPLAKAGKGALDDLAKLAAERGAKQAPKSFSDAERKFIRDAANKDEASYALFKENPKAFAEKVLPDFRRQQLDATVGAGRQASTPMTETAASTGMNITGAKDLFPRHGGPVANRKSAIQKIKESFEE